ncbi:MAG: hypothetical protein LBN39_01820 [Planctomycetaceae bacterium]|jgi:hypothetical protein|nr:hypothetical protein [Planctomycetaceae bacterium]
MLRIHSLTAVSAALSLFCLCSFAAAQEQNVIQKIDEKIPVKTNGGIWFWGDVLYFRDWHIQENAQTKSCRLLDGNAVQRAYGTFDECKNRLDEIKKEENLPPMTGRTVILMHGFGSSPLTMRRLARWLREQEKFDDVLNLAYPSTMGSIQNHAEMLQRVVQNLPPTVSRIDFIGHSLGSIVMRRYLSKSFGPDVRTGRFVMLGPPNHGAEIAVKLIGSDPVRRRFTGRSGDELGINWKETEKTLGIPSCPFMIISGGKGDDEGYSGLIPGDDDGIVRTEGTRLDGAVYWQRFNVRHGEMLLTEEVYEAVLQFLINGGQCLSSGERP